MAAAGGLEPPSVFRPHSAFKAGTLPLCDAAKSYGGHDESRTR